MNTKTFRCAKDCTIERNLEQYPDKAVLFDDDGEVIHQFDSDWRDDQIWAALVFANNAYASGVIYGEALKATVIRRALEICNFE